MFHTTYRLYMVAVSVQWLHLVMMCATYAEYGNDGIDNYVAKTFGSLSKLFSELLLRCFVFIFCRIVYDMRILMSIFCSVNVASQCQCRCSFSLSVLQCAQLAAAGMLLPY